jgi:hypothetical protein
LFGPQSELFLSSAPTTDATLRPILREEFRVPNIDNFGVGLCLFVYYRVSKHFEGADSSDVRGFFRGGILKRRITNILSKNFISYIWACSQNQVGRIRTSSGVNGGLQIGMKRVSLDQFGVQRWLENPNQIISMTCETLVRRLELLDSEPQYLEVEVPNVMQLQFEIPENT